MIRSLICGATAALVLSSSAAFAQETPSYKADWGNKQYIGLNGEKRSDIYADEPMAVKVDVTVKQQGDGPKVAGKFIAGIRNFNPRGGSGETEVTSEVKGTVVAFIPVGSGTSNQYDGEIFPSIRVVEPAGAQVDGTPRWMIGGLNEDLREGTRDYRKDKTKGTGPQNIPAEKVADRLFNAPADAEAAKAAEENKKLVEAALQELLGKSDLGKAIAAARSGNDEDLKKFFAAPPAGLDLAPFAEIKNPGQLRRALDLIAFQVAAGGKTDASITGLFASSVKAAGEVAPPSTTVGAAGKVQAAAGR